MNYLFHFLILVAIMGFAYFWANSEVKKEDD